VAQSVKGDFQDISTAELIFLSAVNGKAKLVVRRGHATVSRSADPQGGDHHQHTRPERPASVALRNFRELRIKSSLNSAQLTIITVPDPVMFAGGEP
jgi:hypothetical protein|tara:strand:+ start:1391 stop:1681 length:291 start_codon:yes stop_codon:yes gene_type:complete